MASRCVPPSMRRHVAALYALCPRGRRLRRRRARAVRRAPRACSTAGRRGWTASLTAPAPGRRPATASRSNTVEIFLALGAHHPPQAAAGDALRRSAERVRARTSPSRATPRGTTCSTTAAGLPTRSAGSCCGSPAIDEPRLDAWSDAICSALQLTNFWQDLEGATSIAGASTCPPRRCAATAPRKAIWPPGGSRRRGARRWPAAVARTRALFSPGARCAARWPDA